MRASLIALLVAAASTLTAQQGSSPDGPALDYTVFKTKIQPIFVASRAGHARCVACHTSGTPLRLQPLAAGSLTWSEEDTRKNFEAMRRVAIPGNAKSRLLVHPLAESAGGDFYHSGGKHWTSQNDAEWQTLKAWIVGDAKSSASSSGSAPTHPRIIQTNSAGDNVHIIDPSTNTVVGVITGIEAGHGVPLRASTARR